MLIEEAQWLGRSVIALDPEAAFPLLDVGSSTSHFREHEQPWIDQYIFAPLRDKGLPVAHLDCKHAPGVDLVGDLGDPAFRKQLGSSGWRSVLCSNLLEHVSDPREVAHSLTDVVQSGGFLFISTPYRYPLHLDPIDNRFRPNPEELHQVFPGTRLVDHSVVLSHTYLQYLVANPTYSAKAAARLMLPFYKPRGWVSAMAHIPWMFRHFQATCVVLQKL